MSEPFFSVLVEHAVELAAQWHDATYRKSRWREAAFEPPVEEVLQVPAMAHVTAVALIVQRAGWGEETVAAAFLHDVLEDVNRYGQRFREERMRELMGERVTGIVRAVTEQKLDAEGQPRGWRVRKEGYLEQLRASPPEAGAVSLADKLHNLYSMNECLSRGIDVFTSGTGRRAMTGGPREQLWFIESVVDASRGQFDERLGPMRVRLSEEIERFRELTKT
jgi:(p)ppGpp synthase/HD superfamily hydrolase